MIGDDQAAWFNTRHICIESDAEDVEQSSRPALFEPEPAAIRYQRIDPCDCGGPRNKMQGKATDAEESDSP